MYITDTKDVKYRTKVMKRLFNNSEVKDTGCIEWNGHRNEKGYGRISFGNVVIKTHRLSYMFANNLNSLSSDQFICHSCDNPACINPEHLWLGNNMDNVIDMVGKGRHWQQKKTHCKQGHEFTEENTRATSKGHRTCIACVTIRNKEYKQRIKIQDRVWGEK